MPGFVGQSAAGLCGALQTLLVQRYVIIIADLGRRRLGSGILPRYTSMLFRSISSNRDSVVVILSLSLIFDKFHKSFNFVPHLVGNLSVTTK